MTTNGVYTFDPNGAHVVHVEGMQPTCDDSGLWGVTASPIGDWIAIDASNLDCGTETLEVTHPDGSGLHAISLAGQDLFGGTAVWKLDGTGLIVGGFSRHAIYAVGVNGEVAGRVLTGDCDAESIAPSPDGTQVAFISNCEPPGGIVPGELHPSTNVRQWSAWIAHFGQAPEFIAPFGVDVAWSPGPAILIDDAGTGDGLWKWASGDIVAQLVSGAGAEVSGVTWAPNGKMFAYCIPYAGLFLGTLTQGSGQTKPLVRGYCDNHGNSSSFAWSPDSSRIAYYNVANGGPLFVTNVDGSGTHLLDPVPFSVSAVAWG